MRVTYTNVTARRDSRNKCGCEVEKVDDLERAAVGGRQQRSGNEPIGVSIFTSEFY